MKFLAIGTIVGLALSGVESRIGNIRQLEAYNCLQFDANGACTQCIPRTYLKDGDCVKVNDLCRDWNESGACTSCYGGYNLQEGQCIADQSGGSSSGTWQASSDYNCLAWTNGACSQCVYRTVLKNGVCTAVSDHCKTWDATTGDCASCYDGHDLANGQCSV